MNSSSSQAQTSALGGLAATAIDLQLHDVGTTTTTATTSAHHEDTEASADDDVNSALEDDDPEDEDEDNDDEDNGQPAAGEHFNVSTASAALAAFANGVSDGGSHDTTSNNSPDVLTTTASASDLQPGVTSAKQRKRRRPFPIHLDLVNGSDSNDGCTKATAVKTRERAADLAGSLKDRCVRGVVVPPDQMVQMKVYGCGRMDCGKCKFANHRKFCPNCRVCVAISKSKCECGFRFTSEKEYRPAKALSDRPVRSLDDECHRISSRVSKLFKATPAGKGCGFITVERRMRKRNSSSKSVSLAFASQQSRMPKPLFKASDDNTDLQALVLPRFEEFKDRLATLRSHQSLSLERRREDMAFLKMLWHLPSVILDTFELFYGCSPIKQNKFSTGGSLCLDDVQHAWQQIFECLGDASEKATYEAPKGTFPNVPPAASSSLSSAAGLNGSSASGAPGQASSATVSTSTFSSFNSRPVAAAGDKAPSTGAASSTAAAQQPNSASLAQAEPNASSKQHTVLDVPAVTSSEVQRPVDSLMMSGSLQSQLDSTELLSSDRFGFFEDPDDELPHPHGPRAGLPPRSGRMGRHIHRYSFPVPPSMRGMPPYPPHVYADLYGMGPPPSRSDIRRHFALANQYAAMHMHPHHRYEYNPYFEQAMAGPMTGTPHDEQILWPMQSPPPPELPPGHYRQTSAADSDFSRPMRRTDTSVPASTFSPILNPGQPQGVGTDGAPPAKRPKPDAGSIL